MVPAMPRLSRMGVLVLPTSLRRLKFCALRAPICMTSMPRSTKSSTSRTSMTSVTTGMPVLGFCLEQQVEAALAHALVGVRGGAGLVGAAAQHGRAGRLAAAGDLDEVVALDRAGARYDLKRAAADLDAAAEVDHGVGGVEFAVGLLEGLGDALDALDDVHRFEQERVDLGGVAHKADDRLVGAAAYMGGEALALDPRDDTGDGLVRGVFAQDGDHVPVLSDARAGRVPANDSSCSCS